LKTSINDGFPTKLNPLAVGLLVICFVVVVQCLKSPCTQRQLARARQLLARARQLLKSLIREKVGNPTLMEKLKKETDPALDQEAPAKPVASSSAGVGAQEVVLNPQVVSSSKASVQNDMDKLPEDEVRMASTLMEKLKKETDPALNQEAPAKLVASSSAGVGAQEVVLNPQVVSSSSKASVQNDMNKLPEDEVRMTCRLP